MPIYLHISYQEDSSEMGCLVPGVVWLLSENQDVAYIQFHIDPQAKEVAISTEVLENNCKYTFICVRILDLLFKNIVHLFFFFLTERTLYI